MIRERWLPLAIILLLAALLAPFLRDFIREVIVIPLLYLFWLGLLLAESIPQAGFWGCFVGLALLIAGRSLLRSPRLAPRRRGTKTASPGRIETWVKLLQQARQEPYYRWRLAQRFRELTLDTLAHAEHLSRKQVRQRLAEGQLGLPPEIRAYLQASLRSFSHLPAASPSFRSRPPASPLDLEPERIVQFLEEQRGEG